MSYWIYQHLGNLSPAELDANDLYREIRAASDGESSLRAFAETADREPDGGPGILWSYRRDFGRVRLLVIDSRCGRVLTEGHRQMVSDPEFDWIEAQVEDGDYDHLLVATSVPWLLPRALHDLEAADEGADGRVARTSGGEACGTAPAQGRPGALGGVRCLVRAARRLVRAGRDGATMARHRRPRSPSSPATSITPT